MAHLTKVLLAFLVVLVMAGTTLLVAQAAPALPLFGANVHPWANWTGDVSYVAQTPGMKIVRWDEQVPGTPVSDVVTHDDYVTSQGLAADIVLVQPCCDYNVTFSYVSQLAKAMGARKPIVEIGNEPDVNGWTSAQYGQALYAANNAMQQAGLHNLQITMAGLADNDQSYLQAVGIGFLGVYSVYADGHFYTQGGSPEYGPLAPDDPDSAHGGLLSFAGAIAQWEGEFPGKQLIVGEWGWLNGAMTESQRESYTRASVSIARQYHVKALIVEEIGSGDGAASDLTGTPTWQTYSAAATAP